MGGKAQFSIVSELNRNSSDVGGFFFEWLDVIDSGWNLPGLCQVVFVSNKCVFGYWLDLVMLHNKLKHKLDHFLIQSYSFASHYYQETILMIAKIVKLVLIDCDGIKSWWLRLSQPSNIVVIPSSFQQHPTTMHGTSPKILWKSTKRIYSMMKEMYPSFRILQTKYSKTAFVISTLMWKIACNMMGTERSVTFCISWYVIRLILMTDILSLAWPHLFHLFPPHQEFKYCCFWSV